MALLTSDDVLNVKFNVSSFKEGYEQDEVDELLDEVTTTMRGLEERIAGSPQSSSHQAAEILLISRDVRNRRLSTTRWSGYHIDEVDAFLDQVVSSMEALESSVRRAGAGPQAYGAEASGYGASAGAYGSVAGGALGGAGAPGDPRYAEAIAQRDQYIAQLQEENAYLRAELEAAQRRLGTSGL